MYKEIVLMQNKEILDNVHEGFKRSEQNQKDIKVNLELCYGYKALAFNLI